MDQNIYKYAGDELDVFFLAVNWKQYWASKITKYFGHRVLEVGAGIGGTTRQLASKQRDLWLGLEPDETMLNLLKDQKEQGVFPDWCQFRLGMAADLAEDELFDSILYIDVLEHIENDQLELELAAAHLDTGGYLVVLSPAYPYLLTEFDKAIGHYRRYTRETIPDLAHVGLKQIDVFFLDSFGVILSLANKLILRSPHPTVDQIRFWDNYILPFSKVIDPLIRFSAGRSILSIWQKN